ncbi:unnamed protein product, partial [Polarella glacialis]
AALSVASRASRSVSRLVAPSGQRSIVSAAAPSLTEIDRLDDFGLVTASASLLHSGRRNESPSLGRGGSADFEAWRAISERASAVLDVTGTPGVLVWLLDALSQADLHP